MMGEVAYAPSSSTNLRLGLGLNGADVDEGARRVVDVVDGDVGEAILGERGELGVIDLSRGSRRRRVSLR